MAPVRENGPDTASWSSGTSISLTLGYTPTNGRVLVAAIGLTDFAAVVQVSSITQTNVSWTKQINDASDAYRDSEIWFGVVSASAGTGITVNLDGTPNNGKVSVCEYSGVLTASFLDKTATNKGFGTTSDSGTTAVTAQNDELVVASIHARNTGSTHSSPTNSFTLVTSAQLAYLEKIVSSTGAQNTGTTVSSDYWVGVIATFKASAAAGPTGGVIGNASYQALSKLVME